MAAIELYSTPLFSDSSLKAYYRLESNSNDATANANNGTDTSISYSAGKFGNAADFNGSTSLVTIADSTSTSITGDITIHFWINCSDVTTNARGEVIAKWQSSGSQLSYLLYHKANSGVFVFNQSNDGASTLASEFTQTSGGISASTWSMVDLVKSGTVGTWYINGTAVSDNGQALFSATKDSTVSTYFGVRNDGGFASYLSGSLDDVALFSRALTAAEISNLYNGTFPTTTNALFFGAE